MKKMIIGLALAVCAGCNSKPQTSTPADTASTPKTFQMIDVPMTISEPGQRADYLANHYWDRFNFSDTAYIDLPEVTEQALSNFINILNYTTDPDVSRGAIRKMLAKAEADSAMFAYFFKLYDKYLYDPNSPMRNEEYYIPVLETVVASDQISDVEKIRPQHQLTLALKNRVGQKAADFKYTLASGATGRLYGVKSPYVILFFYNPDCEMCKEVHHQLTSSPVISEMEKKKQLKIVALYPDEDLAAWKKHLPEIPSHWINGYDKELTMRNEKTYDLKAIPTLYLLDKDKKVLLKDVTFPQLQGYLEQMQP